jgi:hypothetical protein
MVATSVEILHQQDFAAKSQVEVMVGKDHVVRVNIDGVCALRIRMEKTCQFDYVGDSHGHYFSTNYEGD